MHGAEEEPVKRFINDVERGEEQQTGLDEGGKIFEFAVAVGMAFVGRFIRDAHGEKGNDGRDQVQTRVQRFGEDAQAARAENEKSLQRNEQYRGADAQQRRPPLFTRFLVLPNAIDVQLDYLKYREIPHSVGVQPGQIPSTP